MAKGSKNIPFGNRKQRVLAENPTLLEKISSLLIVANADKIEPPCLVYRTRSKRTAYDHTRNPKGVYRQICIKRGGKWVWEYVHRLVYILHYGDIAKGYEVCHRCHVRSCARIEHLWSALPRTHRGMDAQFRRDFLPILQKSGGKMILG